MAICILKTFGLNWTTSDCFIFNESWECFQHSTFTPFQTESMVVAPILVSKKEIPILLEKNGSSYSCFPKKNVTSHLGRKKHDFRDIPTPHRAEPSFPINRISKPWLMASHWPHALAISTPRFCLSPPTTSELQRKAPVIRRRFCCVFFYLRWFSNV